tara:strand:+ start:716 stop:2638 length:1923 start_codon:yes stop_codon:yes gene_type:complete
LGDTLDFWAWLAGCRRMFPDAKIAAYTGNGRDNFDALMGKHSPADTAFPFKRHVKFWRFFRGEVLNSSWPSFVHSEKQHYDIFFDLRPYGAGIYTKASFFCPVWFEDAYHHMLSHHTAELSSLGLNVISLRNLATGMDGTYKDIQFPLEEYPLPISPYVTIHHGGCAAPKLWHSDYWEEVVRWLKGKDFKVLQLGISGEKYIPGAEDLRNKTTLEQTAYIIKHSSHHIDCEGSLVRLAQCGNIQTKCTVLGGASQKALFSFPQNNNLWLDICSPCAYINADFWRGKCPRRYEGEEIEHCCMQKLTPDIVIDSLVPQLTLADLSMPAPRAGRIVDLQTEIAVCRMRGLGDVIMMIPTLAAIKEALPDKKLTVITSKEAAYMLKGVDCVDTIVKTDYRHFASGLPPPPKVAKKHGYIVNLINTVDFGDICFNNNRPDNFATVASKKLRTHLSIDDDYLIPSFPVRLELREKIRNEFNVPKNKPLIGCQLTTNGISREMNLRSWHQLFISAPDDWFFVLFSDKRVDINLPNTANTTGELNIVEFVHGISICDVFICPDSVGMHISPRLNVPVVLLAGSTKIEYHTKYQKPGMHFPVFCEPELDCSPCFDWQMRHDCFKKAGAPWCINQIESTLIINKVKEVLF